MTGNNYPLNWPRIGSNDGLKIVIIFKRKLLKLKDIENISPLTV